VVSWCGGVVVLVFGGVCFVGWGVWGGGGGGAVRSLGLEFLADAQPEGFGV